MTFKEWTLVCISCGYTSKDLLWDYQLEDAKCTHCDGPMGLDVSVAGQSAGVVTDEIPGGIEIRHGICNPDGSPKRYYSKTEIKRAANERGYTIAGDTPKPYNVRWSGRQKRTDGISEG